MTGLIGVWLILVEGEVESWPIGLPVVILLVIFCTDEGEHTRWPVSLRGAALFVPYFCWQSLASGFDVAARALRPDMRLRPGLQRYRFILPEGSARRLFVHSITLMPGTLSVRVDDESVLIHMLDTTLPVTESLQRLEERVGAIYGISPAAGKKD
jgi:multicomponent Na+:H+ antiporter subunit E